MWDYSIAKGLCFRGNSGCASTRTHLETELTVDVLTGSHRFEALLRGAATAPHDQPLLERPSWLVAPTLGSIIPDWLLVIPRRAVLNFRDWARIEHDEPESVLRDVRKHLGLAQEEVIWFEHGPSGSRTPVGCGLDYAHLHILIRPRFTFTAFAERARALADLEWRVHGTGTAYSELEESGSYFVAGCGKCVVSAPHVESAGSQFFRRVIDMLVDHDGEWDYRRSPHFENIRRTIRTFRTLESAARRER